MRHVIVTAPDNALSSRRRNSPKALSTLYALDADFSNISGMKNKHVNHAHERSFHSKSCHMATNVNTTHTFRNFLRDPPRGIYIYLISHLLNEACQVFQNSSRL
jgi:hypothetical protein